MVVDFQMANFSKMAIRLVTSSSQILKRVNWHVGELCSARNSGSEDPLLKRGTSYETNNCTWQPEFTTG